MSVESPQGLTQEDVLESLNNLTVDLLFKMQNEPREKVTAVLRAVRADYLRFAATKPSRADMKAPDSKKKTPA